MPFEYNPYYYRGHNDIEIEKYEQAINDFAQVAGDTTANTSILSALTEACKMSGNMKLQSTLAINF